MASIFDQIAGGANEDSTSLVEMDLDDESGEASPTTYPDANDDSRTPHRLRESVQELLKYGLLEEHQKPNLYRIALTHIEEIAEILEPLDLGMGIDEVRGLVFLTVRSSEMAEQDDWSHPLVRKQRLNLEQSLLVAILRQYFIAYEQESGTGASHAQVAVDDLIPQLQTYLGEIGSDAKERTRVINLLDQLKGHGLVSALDAQERVVIRPIIAHLVNPENLQTLLLWLQSQVEIEDASNDSSEALDSEGDA